MVNDLWEAITMKMENVVDGEEVQEFRQKILKQQVLKNVRVITVIHFVVNKTDHYLSIGSAATIKQTWDNLQNGFQVTLKVQTIRLQITRQEFQNLSKLMKKMKLYGHETSNEELLKLSFAPSETVSDTRSFWSSQHTSRTKNYHWPNLDTKAQNPSTV